MDPHGIELVSSTYRNLLDSLGGKLTPETVATIIKGESPFDIPDQSGADLHQLRRSLKKFRKLVQSKGWETPGLRQRLLSDLSQQTAAVGMADVKRETAVDATASRKEETLPIPLLGNRVQSPDGRYLITIHMDSSRGGWTMDVYDRQSKGTVQIPGTTPSTNAFFSHNGTELFFPLPTETFTAVAFRNGTPDYTQTRKLGTDRSVAGLAVLRGFGKTPGFFLAGEQAERIFRVDTMSGKSDLVDVKGFLKGLDQNPAAVRHATASGVVPGTDDVFALYTDQVTLKSHLVVASISSEGRLTAKGEWASWPAFAGATNVTWSTDGTTAFIYRDRDSVLRAYRGGGRTAELFSSAISGLDFGEVLSVRANPRSSEVAVVVKKPGPGARVVEFFDSGTALPKGHFELPIGVHYIEYSTDGEVLLGSRAGMAPVSIPYQKRINP